MLRINGFTAGTAKFDATAANLPFCQNIFGIYQGFVEHMTLTFTADKGFFFEAVRAYVNIVSVFVYRFSVVVKVFFSANIANGYQLLIASVAVYPAVVGMNRIVGNEIRITPIAFMYIA